MTFAELIELYQAHLRELRRHPSTLYNHRRVTTDFAAFCVGELGLADPTQLQPAHLVAYFQLLQRQSFAPLVRYSRQRLVRSWLAWATFRGHLFSDPGRDFVMRHPPMLPRGAPSERQVDWLLAAPDKTVLGRRDQALLEFLYGTGARIGETLAVDLADLQLEQRQVVIRRGKSGSSRVLPLGRQLVATLERYLAEVRPQLERGPCAALWLTCQGRRLVEMAAQARIRGWARQAGVRITAHQLRHAFATHLLTRGAPIVAVQRLLGHVSLGMTSRYTHLLTADVRQALAEHHPRGKRKRRRRRPSS